VSNFSVCVLLMQCNGKADEIENMYEQGRSYEIGGSTLYLK